MEKIKNKIHTGNINDDTTFPNIILSYRRFLLIGEPLTIEILNLPETKIKNEYYVILSLTGNLGKKIFYSKKIFISQNVLSEKRINLDSIKFSNNTYLSPILKIYSKAGRLIKTFSSGLGYIRLKATYNRDFTWIRQPLRDILIPEKNNIKFLTKNNTIIVTGNIKAKDKIMTIELLKDYDEIKAVDFKNEYKLEKDETLVLINQVARKQVKPVKGYIKILNGKLKYFNNYIRGRNKRENVFSWKGNKVYYDWKLNVTRRGGFFKISGNDKTKIQIKYNVFNLTIPLK